MLKSTVLDPQGQTIQRALGSLGYAKVQDVRQGKFFVLALNGMTRDEAKTQVERIAKDVLTNPIIEEFRFEIIELIAAPVAFFIQESPVPVAPSKGCATLNESPLAALLKPGNFPGAIHRVRNCRLYRA